MLIGAALLFSLMALCAKAASARLPGEEVACVRFLLGLCSIVVPLSTGQKLRPVKYRSLFLRGLLGGGAVLLYFLAIAHLPVGIATLLNASWPIFVAPFSSLFLDEPLRIRALLALLVTSVGVLLVVFGGTPAQTGAASFELGPHGYLWGLCGLSSALLSAAAVTTIRSMRRHEGSWEIFLAFCLIGSLMTGIPTAFAWVTPTREEALLLLFLGLFSLLAQLAMTHALRDVRAVTAGIILQLTPISTLLLGAALFAERPTQLGWAGAALTLFGVTWATIAR